MAPTTTDVPAAVAQVLVTPAVGVSVPGQVASVVVDLEGEAAAQDDGVPAQPRGQLRQPPRLLPVAVAAVHPHQVLLGVHVDLDAAGAVAALGAVGLGGSHVRVAAGGPHRDGQQRRRGRRCRRHHGRRFRPPWSPPPPPMHPRAGIRVVLILTAWAAATTQLACLLSVRGNEEKAWEGGLSSSSSSP